MFRRSLTHSAVLSVLLLSLLSNGCRAPESPGPQEDPADFACLENLVVEASQTTVPLDPSFHPLREEYFATFQTQKPDTVRAIVTPMNDGDEVSWRFEGQAESTILTGPWPQEIAVIGGLGTAKLLLTVNCADGLRQSVEYALTVTEDTIPQPPK